MSFLDKLKSLVLPSLPTNTTTTKKKNKSVLVVEELVMAFEESMDELSTNRSLMFNTAYVVYVPKKDYNRIHSQFGVLTREAAERFQEIINETLKRNKELRYEPLYNAWSFDIISLQEDGVDIPDEDNPESKIKYEDLEEKFVAVRSSVAPSEIFNFANLNDDDVVKTNRSQPNSVFNRMQRLSIGAIRGLKPNGKGFTYPIDLKGADVSSGTTPSQPTSQQQVLATMKCADMNVRFMDSQENKYDSIAIRESEFFIGGASASEVYQGKPMVRLDSSAVMSPHFGIRQDNITGAFYIYPYGAVEQGGIPMPKNQWTRLSDKNASIKINGNIELIFNRK